MKTKQKKGCILPEYTPFPYSVEGHKSYLLKHKKQELKLKKEEKSATNDRDIAIDEAVEEMLRRL